MPDQQYLFLSQTEVCISEISLQCLDSSIHQNAHSLVKLGHFSHHFGQKRSSSATGNRQKYWSLRGVLLQEVQAVIEYSLDLQDLAADTSLPKGLGKVTIHGGKLETENRTRELRDVFRYSPLHSHCETQVE